MAPPLSSGGVHSSDTLVDDVSNRAGIAGASGAVDKTVLPLPLPPLPLPPLPLPLPPLPPLLLPLPPLLLLPPTPSVLEPVPSSGVLSSSLAPIVRARLRKVAISAREVSRAGQ